MYIIYRLYCILKKLYIKIFIKDQKTYILWLKWKMHF